MNLFKSIKTPTLIGCISAVIIGLLLLIWPITILRFICILLALVLIAVGCLRVMNYFKETKKVGLPPLNLAIGLALVVLGIAMIAENGMIILLFPFLLALAVCFATFILLQRTYDLFKAHIADWWIVGIMALVGLVLSIFLLAGLGNSMGFVAMSTIGAMLSLSSFLGSLTEAAGLSGAMILPALSLIYSAAAIIAMEVFIDMWMGKKSSAAAAKKPVQTEAPSSDSLDDLK